MDLLNDLPTTMTLGGKTYEILRFTQKDKKVDGWEMKKRAKKMGANLGEIDGRHILNHQDEIPVALRGKVLFVFPDWRCDVLFGHPMTFIYWVNGCWIENWIPGTNDFFGGFRVLRRHM